MSIIILELMVRCDQAGCLASEYGSDPEEVRAEARADGWVCDDSGDHCPKHQI